MHSLATRSEFLRLRVSGMSFARISRQLGVSKPTLMTWSRESRPEIASRIAEAEEQLAGDLGESVNTELANLNRRLTALKQELFSRALREISTPCLETLCGEVTDRLRQLESVSSWSPSSSSSSNPAGASRSPEPSGVPMCRDFSTPGPPGEANDLTVQPFNDSTLAPSSSEVNRV
jgi:transposase-like protein